MPFLQRMRNETNHFMLSQSSGRKERVHACRSLDRITNAKGLNATIDEPQFHAVRTNH